MAIDSRIRIKQLVWLRPGVHLRELQRLLGSSFSSTRYNVDKLAENGEISRFDAYGYSRLYPPGLAENERKLLSALRRGSDSKILLSLLYEKRLSQKRLCEITRLAKSTVSERLAFLIRDNVIQSVKDPTGKMWFSLIDSALLNRLLQQNAGLIAKATARFVELWDF